MIFSHTQGLDVQASETNSPTLRTGGAGMAVVYPIDDARELEKHQNGTGIGDEGAPAYTLDRQQAPAVAIGYKKTLAQKDEEFWAETTISRNLTVTDNSHEIRVTMLTSNQSVVRRLTPVECERLQGFPDGWTDGQADSNRYKQMGNAVAVPVVSWIINRMVGASK